MDEEWVALDDNDFETVIDVFESTLDKNKESPSCLEKEHNSPCTVKEDRPSPCKEKEYQPPLCNETDQTSPCTEKDQVSTSTDKYQSSPCSAKDETSLFRNREEYKCFALEHDTQHPLSGHTIINENPNYKYDKLICIVYQYFGHPVLYQLRQHILYDLIIACVKSGIQLENSKAEISLIMFYIHSSSHHHENWLMWLNTQYNTFKSLTRRYYIAHRTHSYLDFIKWRPLLLYTPGLISGPHSPQPSTNRNPISEHGHSLNWLCCLQL